MPKDAVSYFFSLFFPAYLTTVACGNVDATTAPLLAGPVQAHGATIRGVTSPVREGLASTGHTARVARAAAHA